MHCPQNCIEMLPTNYTGSLFLPAGFFWSSSPSWNFFSQVVLPPAIHTSKTCNLLCMPFPKYCFPFNWDRALHRPILWWTVLIGLKGFGKSLPSFYLSCAYYIPSFIDVPLLKTSRRILASPETLWQATGLVFWLASRDWITISAGLFWEELSSHKIPPNTIVPEELILHPENHVIPASALIIYNHRYICPNSRVPRSSLPYTQGSLVFCFFFLTAT